MIRAPRYAGEYNRRNEDCQRAIEPPANMMIHGSRAPFLDFVSLFYAILPEAKAAGWREFEVRSALESITRDLRPPTR
jgi:hypothetical protein